MNCLEKYRNKLIGETNRNLGVVVDTPEVEAVHDFKPFRVLFGQTPEGRKRLRHYEDIYPPVTHPVVRVHPVTGRKVIFVNPQFTLHIKGMEPAESDHLLDFLYSRTLINEYQYRHRWQPEMVVFWDNRCVQHSAVHDYYPQRRLMERVTICGDRPIADADPPVVRQWDITRGIGRPREAVQDRHGFHPALAHGTILCCLARTLYVVWWDIGCPR